MSNYIALSNEARTLRAAIATYRKPMDEVMVEMVLAREGQAGLDSLKAASAQYLAEQEARLAEITPAIEAHEATMCRRCSGTGDYQAPTSHYRGGRPVCFDCKGSGQRK